MSFFNFVRIFNDGRRLSVSNHADWLYYYFNNQFQNLAIFKNNSKISDSKIILWDGHVENRVINEAREGFDICHGMTLIANKNDIYTDCMHFATRKNNHKVINSYLNNIDIFSHFKLYFMEISKDMINKIKPYEPINSAVLNKIEEDQVCESNNKSQSFLDKIKLKRFQVEGIVGKVFLTKREISILLLCAQRCTSKEIAIKLNISFRTVEGHLENIKNKLGCASIHELRSLGMKLL